MKLPPEKYADATRQVLMAIDACFVDYFWKTIIRPRVNSIEGISQTISGFDNASVEATLISLRRLNDFFGNAGRKDDLNATDLLFLPSTKGFLTQIEKDLISKHIAHLTGISIFKPECRFEYKRYLGRMIPTALRTCEAVIEWGKIKDIALARQAQACAEVCQQIFEHYANA
jgi:hypothetical protein